jgi:hypothetical protein
MREFCHRYGHKHCKKLRVTFGSVSSDPQPFQGAIREWDSEQLRRWHLNRPDWRFAGIASDRQAEPVIHNYIL